jgi:cholesterol transport system auxiliary component
MNKIYSKILIIFFCIACTSCLSTEYLTRNQYALNVTLPQKMRSFPNNKNLLIDNITTAPQFADKSFVYRKGQSQYLTDYYNVFFAFPGEQITQLTTNYINASNLYKHVTNDNYLINPNYILRGEILELYADYRNNKQPKAVITIRFVLIKLGETKNNIIFDKTLSQKIPLKKKDTQSLVYAWDTGLSRIFRALAYTLKRYK